MFATKTRFVASSLTLVWALGCGPSAEEPVAKEAAEPKQEVSTPADLPEPEAEAVWQYLQSNNYQEWQVWPGKGEFFEGKEPHGALLTNYLNPPAYQAVSGKQGSMPNGAIIVKENFTPEKTLAAVTVMFKSEGYNSEHNDWFWLKRLPDGTVEASGKVESCQNCHGTASGNDYVLTGPLQ